MPASSKRVNGAVAQIVESTLEGLLLSVLPLALRLIGVESQDGASAFLRLFPSLVPITNWAVRISVLRDRVSHKAEPVFFATCSVLLAREYIVVCLAVGEV